jgi:hypothetical protein
MTHKQKLAQEKLADKRALEKIRKEIEQGKSLTDAIKPLWSVLAKRLRENYPVEYGELKELSKKNRKKVDMKPIADTRKPRANRVYSDELRDKKYTDFLKHYETMKLKQAMYAAHCSFSLLAQMETTRPDLYAIRVEMRSKKMSDARRGTNESIDYDNVPDRHCAACGKVMRFADFCKNLKHIKSQMYYKFIAKKTCSKKCQYLSLANTVTARMASKDYADFEKPLTFKEYLLGEFRYIFKDHHYSDEMLIDLFSRRSGLPVEQIERILACQETLTELLAKKLRDNGVCFKVDTMMKIQAKDVYKITS